MGHSYSMISFSFASLSPVHNMLSLCISLHSLFSPSSESLSLLQNQLCLCLFSLHPMASSSSEFLSPSHNLFSLCPLSSQCITSSSSVSFPCSTINSLCFLPMHPSQHSTVCSLYASFIFTPCLVLPPSLSPFHNLPPLYPSLSLSLQSTSSSS